MSDVEKKEVNVEVLSQVLFLLCMSVGWLVGWLVGLILGWVGLGWVGLCWLCCVVLAGCVGGEKNLTIVPGRVFDEQGPTERLVL